MEKTLSTNAKVIILVALLAAVACVFAIRVTVSSNGRVAHWGIPHAAEQAASMPFDSSH